MLTSQPHRITGPILVGLTLAACPALGGCFGPVDPEGEFTALDLDATDADDERVQGAAQALTLNTVGPYGWSTGTPTGPSGLAGNLTPITKFAIWSDSDYIHAIKLWWGTTSVVYGDTSHGSKNVVALSSGEYISQVFIDVDVDGVLRGVSFDSNFNVGIMAVGYIGDGFATVLTGTNPRLTDLKGYINTFGGQKSLGGIKLYYTNN